MNRRPSIAFAVLAGSLLSPLAARAYVLPYGGVDVFLPANAGDGLANDTQDGLMPELAALGYSTSGDIKTGAAVGPRLGLFFEVTDCFGLGVSAGYLSGPNSSDTINLDSPTLTGAVKDTRSISFVRELLEPTWRIELSDTVTLRLGGGVGYAQGRVHEKWSCSGTACKVQGTIFTASSSWSGLTWEVTPAVGIGPAVIGLRYAGFPSFAGNANDSHIDWTSMGFFAGVAF